MKKIITCLFAAFICFGLVTQQADTKSWKTILKPDKKESKQDKPVDSKDSKQDKPADAKESKEQPKKSKYNIGDKGPGGGTVFHVAGNIYMEVSPILNAVDMGADWYDAVKVAKNYKGGGFTNWQLPTKEQLNNMYENLILNKGIGNFGSNYWSSSEYFDGVSAYIQNFSNNAVGLFHDGKTRTYSVRAVRSFTP